MPPKTDEAFLLVKVSSVKSSGTTESQMIRQAGSRLMKVTPSFSAWR
jgi:hypothetical protein